MDRSGSWRYFPVMETLAAHRDCRITLHRVGPRPAPIVVVTFGGQPSDLADAGFGTAYCRKQGWDNIYVAQRHGTQYQGLSLQDFQAAVAPAVQGQDVVCYGPSLGAYAAFYYGGAIDARIIGGAPMFPAWPAFANRAYADLAITHGALTDGPRASRPPVVIFDPLQARDLKMVRDMLEPAYPDLRRVEYRGAGHTVLITLQQSGQLHRLIHTLIQEDRIIPPEPLREGMAIYHLTQGRLLQASDPDGAIRQLERALQLQPARQALAILLSVLLRHDRLDEAQALIDRAEASGDRNLTIIPSLRQRLRDRGLRVLEPPPPARPIRAAARGPVQDRATDPAGRPVGGPHNPGGQGTA